MLGKLDCYVTRVGSLLTAAVLIAGMAGCTYNPPSQNLEIRTWYDLNAVRGNLTGNYILMNDLDSSTTGYDELASPTANEGKGWQPIGTENQTFTGSLDGHGYELRDLFINRPDESGVALFGAVDDEGVIEDVGVVNASVDGNKWVGSLAGHTLGNVANCYATGRVTGYAGVGGLLGGSDGNVSNSYSSGIVTATGGVEYWDSAAGGLVGLILTGSVTNSYSSGSVSGNRGVGGLVGYNAGSTVSDSHSTSNVSGQELVGGLVGFNDGGAVSSSYATGSVTGTSYVGGLVGANLFYGPSTGTVSNSYATGSVTGTSCVGGLVGVNRFYGPGTGTGTAVSNSYSIGNVTGNSSVGGLVGYSLNSTVSDSFWDIETSGQNISDGGTGKNTTEMQDIATFLGAAWNITAVALNETNHAYIWNIINNVTYPFLSWQP
jgi:The GLUG motif